MAMEKNSVRKRGFDKICDDWTKFIEAEYHKESWDGIKGTLLLSEAEMILKISVRVAGIKLISFGVGADEKRNGSGK